MLRSVRSYLSLFGKVDERILKAMEKIDRKDFIEDNYYFDDAMPIGYGQTISQPNTVGRMLALLELRKGNKVLEIGTGSGWNAALIGYIVKPGKVLSLERIDELCVKARENIKRYNLRNIKIENKDFRKLKEKFDRIILTAGISYWQEKVIEELVGKILKKNGILVCPYRSGPLLILKNKPFLKKKSLKGKEEKQNAKISKEHTNEEYAFVPLVFD